MSKAVSILVLSLLAVFAIGATTTAPANADLASRVQDLLKRLDDDDWEVRRKAAKELPTLPLEALSLINQAAQTQALSPEVENSLQGIVGRLREQEAAANQIRAAEALQERYRDAVLTDYARAGRTSPAWDAAAREAIVIHCAIAQQPSPSRPAIRRSIDRLQKCMNAGCDDPIIRLWLAEDTHRFHHEPVDVLPETDAATTVLLASHYSPRLKLNGLLDRLRARADDADINEPGHAQLQQRADLEAAIAVFAQVLPSPANPPEWFLDKALQLAELQQLAGVNTGDPDQRLSAVLQAASPQANLPRLFRISLELSPVPASSPHERAVRLADVDRLLTEAVQVGPKNVAIRRLRMKWAIASDDGGAALRAAYADAIKLDPSDYETHAIFMSHLINTNAGDETLLDYADECIATHAWFEKTPLLAAHALEAQHVGPEKVTQFYSDPAIWKRIQLTFDGLESVYPHDPEICSHYARLACFAERWDIAADQFDRAGEDLNERLFNTSEEAEYYAAKAHRLATSRP